MTNYIDKNYMCERCKDTGVVEVLEQVYPDEPHQALIGTEPCPECTDYEEMDFSGATEGDR